MPQHLLGKDQWRGSKIQFLNIRCAWLSRITLIATAWCFETIRKWHFLVWSTGPTCNCAWCLKLLIVWIVCTTMNYYCLISCDYHSKRAQEQTFGISNSAISIGPEWLLSLLVAKHPRHGNELHWISLNHLTNGAVHQIWVGTFEGHLTGSQVLKPQGFSLAGCYEDSSAWFMDEESLSIGIKVSSVPHCGRADHNLGLVGSFVAIWSQLYISRSKLHGCYQESQLQDEFWMVILDLGRLRQCRGRTMSCATRPRMISWDEPSSRVSHEGCTESSHCTCHTRRVQGRL